MRVHAARGRQWGKPALTRGHLALLPGLDRTDWGVWGRLFNAGGRVELLREVTLLGKTQGGRLEYVRDDGAVRQQFRIVSTT